MTTALPKAGHEGELQLGTMSLKCAVLPDGTRIINHKSVFKAFGRPRRGPRYDRGDKEKDGIQLPGFIDANNLIPFIPEGFKDWIQPVKYIDSRGKETEGFKAEIIPMVCEVYLDARAKNALRTSQLPLAQASEILVRSLSKIGITALVDEATGYQKTREKDDLQKLLALYISEELLPWTMRFPEEFYREMFRLNGWEYRFTNKRPRIIGKYTNKYIYDKLPPGIREGLEKKNPKNEAGNRLNRHHQFLTDGIGDRHLERQIDIVLTLMKVSSNWRHFQGLFARRFPEDPNSEQMLLDTGADDYIDADSEEA